MNKNYEVKQADIAIEGESQIDLFKKKQVRKVLYKGEWWFAVSDVIEALLDVSDGSDYLKKLRQRDEVLKEGWGQIVTPLPFVTPGGVQEVNAINIEGIFRLMQSAPGKNAEPFKKWLAKVGFERLQEIQNPEIAIKRAMTFYKAKGYDDAWVEARIQNKLSRDQLESEWNQRGIKVGVEYAVLTDAISIETFGLSTAQHKIFKGLTSQPLRDNMTPIELTLTTLGEQATKEIAKSRNARGFEANRIAAKTGGSIAGQARGDIERATGKRIISSQNYLTKESRKNNQGTNLQGINETKEKIEKIKKLKN